MRRQAKEHIFSRTLDKYWCKTCSVLAIEVCRAVAIFLPQIMFVFAAALKALILVSFGVQQEQMLSLIYISWEQRRNLSLFCIHVHKSSRACSEVSDGSARMRLPVIKQVWPESVHCSLSEVVNSGMFGAWSFWNRHFQVRSALSEG